LTFVKKHYNVYIKEQRFCSLLIKGGTWFWYRRADSLSLRYGNPIRFRADLYWCPTVMTVDFTWHISAG